MSDTKVTAEEWQRLADILAKPVLRKPVTAFMAAFGYRGRVDGEYWQTIWYSEVSNSHIAGDPLLSIDSARQLLRCTFYDCVFTVKEYLEHDNSRAAECELSWEGLTVCASAGSMSRAMCRAACLMQLSLLKLKASEETAVETAQKCGGGNAPL